MGILDNLGNIGIGALVFLAFIVFCIVKGGNNKNQPGPGGGSTTSSQTPPTSNTQNPNQNP